MSHFKLNKPSKRMPARRRYKILRKIREHNRKVRKEAKKAPKKNKPLIQVPNICPFKDQILQDVKEMKEHEASERIRRREELKMNAAKSSLTDMVQQAEERSKVHTIFTSKVNTDLPGTSKLKDTSLKAYYKEFRKVIEAADVILEVADARDPLGTRCTQVSEAVFTGGQKRLVLVLNKADLVPRPILQQWLVYLKKQGPVIAIKACTQHQNRKLCQRKLAKHANSTKGSASVGAEQLMSLLANYCRNKDIKTSITVGVVGMPNVGKSSIINSLKRSRACVVGAQPGSTKSMQVVQLDAKIKLLDCPGIVFKSSNDTNTNDVWALQNSIKVQNLEDPLSAARAILLRTTKMQMMQLYDVPDYESDEHFFKLKAERMGRFIKGGIPDLNAAAKSLIEDWNSGKIKYHVVPPEVDNEELPAHLSSAIVSEMAKEFDLDNLASMEIEHSEEQPAPSKRSILSHGTAMETDDDLLCNKKISITVKNNAKKSKNHDIVKNRKHVECTNRMDKDMSLDGNQQFNKNNKRQFKKQAKEKRRQLAREMDVSVMPTNA